MRYLKPLISFLVLTLPSCAVRESPPGGPVDKTPPSIVYIKPDNGSTNLPAASQFKIKFSESMDRERIESAIFLSPVFWDFPSLDWSGRELTIIPPDNLRPNTTYILTIGADASDAHGVKMGRSRSFAFSTGATIDSGSIAGMVFFENDQRVFYDIWAYALADTSLDFISRIPDYATQVDSAGNFSLEHLGAGRFLMICIDDKNDDLFWDPSAEAIGLPHSIFGLAAGENISGIVFKPSIMDTVAAYLSGAGPENNHRIAFELSEPPDESQKLDPQNYLIKYVDSDSILQTGMVYVGENAQMTLETDPQRDGAIYSLIPRNLRTARGTSFDTTGARFTGIDTPDTIGPKLLSTFPPNRSSGTFQDTVIEMTFSERLLSLPFQDAVRVIADSTDTLKFVVAWPMPNTARLRFPGKIPRERNIAVSLDPAKVYDILRNRMPDSVAAFSFRLPPADTVGSVTASMEPTGSGLFVGVLASMTRGVTHKGRFDSAGRLNLTTVMPGSYRFEYYEDADSNGEWTAGLARPLRFAEPFSFLADTIQVRSRWETDIGVVSLPELGH